MKTAVSALEYLMAGNRRFRDSGGRWGAVVGPDLRRKLTEGQSPFAIVLGCADSRVPVEMIFDCGPGDLFVIRVAGNVVAPSITGSVEFAATQFNTRLVVVLGHTGCGAVMTTIQALRESAAAHSPSLEDIVERIRPTVAPLLADERLAPDALIARAVQANICASVAQLQADSHILARLVQVDGLHIVGAEYSLASGKVDFFHNLPDLRR